MNAEGQAAAFQHKALQHQVECLADIVAEQRDRIAEHERSLERVANILESQVHISKTLLEIVGNFT